MRRDHPNESPPSKRRASALERVLERQVSWLLLGLVGGACAGVMSLEPPAAAQLASDVTPGSSRRPSGSLQVATANAVMPFPAPRAPEQKTVSPEPVAMDENAPPPRAPEPNAAPVARPEPDEATAEAIADEDAPLWDPSISEQWALAARSVAPGQTWQDAVNIADWPNVAQLIDALPPEKREEPGTRYARAVAARELGQCEVTLRALHGLESALPLLENEIQSARARCQLEVGPFEEAYEYFTRESTPENLILAARASLNGGELARAQLTVERAFQKIRRQGSETRAGRRNEIAARVLRARISEARQQPRTAARDWLWLATEAPTDEQAKSADQAYERLSEERLTKQQRMQRLSSFGRAGRIDLALRERQLLSAAPGVEPRRGEVTAALAWAYYYSRQDYAKAAELFREAAEQSEESRVKYLYFTARALSRGNQNDPAIREYRELTRRYPQSPYAEQAYFRIAHLEYELGRWDEAERDYSAYLERYGRTNGERASASRYELAITRLAARERTDEAARYLAQLARRERNPQRRALLSHLEAVGLQTTQEPRKVVEAMERYQAIIEDQPLSFAAMASAARLRELGRPDAHRVRLPSSFDVSFDAGNMLPHLPDKARFLATIGLHTDAERALFDQRNEVRRRYSDRQREALCQMFGALDRGYRSYALADSWLSSAELSRPPTADNLWAWRCAYPKPYSTIVESVERRYQLPESLVHAVMRQESAFRPNVVSPVGAVGLMQLMPNTARRAADEITQQPGAPWVPDPHRPTNVVNNVELGGFYLSKLLSLLDGQMPAAIAAYNAGPHAVSQWLQGGEELPVDVWVARIPYLETRDYVQKVLGNWIAYRFLGNPGQLPKLELMLSRSSQAQALANAY